MTNKRFTSVIVAASILAFSGWDSTLGSTIQLKSDQVNSTDLALNNLPPSKLSFNVICWFYGSNPSRYASLLTLAQLPASRARSCPSEYKQADQNWRRLLQPYRRLGTSKE